MRAQTTFDFAIGMSIFIITVVFVFGFIPGMLQPFEEGTQEETVSANRVAGQLVEGELGNPSQPYELVPKCTRAFFDDSPVPVSSAQCAFDNTDDIKERVGLRDRDQLNITLHAQLDGDDPLEMLCWDESAGELAEHGSGSCDTSFKTGEDPPVTSQSVVVARRTGYMNDNDVRVLVRTW